MSRARANDSPRLSLPARIAAEIVAAARSAAPDEGCGVLIGRTERGCTEVVGHAPGRNVHRRPADRFHLAPEDFLGAERAARAAGLEVVGFWHSHPASPAEPSAVDRDESWEGYSYLIVSLAADPVDLRSWRWCGDALVEEEIDGPSPAVEGMRP